jgi:hypothetical protein
MHPQDRRRLTAEPDLMGAAVEEFLRAYAPVTMAREVVKETQVAGCTFKPGHMVLLSFPAANRDPAMFPDADQVVIDRAQSATASNSKEERMTRIRLNSDPVRTNVAAD